MNEPTTIAEIERLFHECGMLPVVQTGEIRWFSTGRVGTLAELRADEAAALLTHLRNIAEIIARRTRPAPP